MTRTKVVSCRCASSTRLARILPSLVVVAVLAWPACMTGAADEIFRLSFDGSAQADVAAGQPEPTTADGVQFVAGRTGQALRMPPKAVCEYSAAGNFAPAMGTVSFWFRPDAFMGAEAEWNIFIENVKGGKTNEFRIAYYRGQLMLYPGDRDTYSIRRNVNLQPGRWYHIAATWSLAGNESHLYLDAREIAKGRANAEFTPSSVLQIGGIDGQYTPEGCMDDLRIWSEMLSIEAIAASIGLEPVSSNIKAPKTLYRETNLVHEGALRCTVVHPAGEAGREAAAKIADAVAALTGKRPKTVAASEIDGDDVEQTVAVLLGNVQTNPHMLPLHLWEYVAADAVRPGAGGYEVRTIPDPWGTGCNVISVAASDSAGLTRGGSALAEAFGDLEGTTVPKLLLSSKPISKSAPDTAARERQLAQREETLRTSAAGGFRHNGYRLGHYAKQYQASGDDGWAEMFLGLYRVLERWREQVGFGDFPDSWAQYALTGWDLIEESPVFSDADRLAITQFFLELTDHCVGIYRDEGTTITHNHNTYPARSAFGGGMYFSKYYDLRLADEWLETADHVFQNLAKGKRALEDCNHYQWYSLRHMMFYALARPYPEYFQSGNAAAAGRLAMVTTTNLRTSAGYGDFPARAATFAAPFLANLAYAYNDGRYLSLLPDGYRPRGAAIMPALERRAADELAGVATVRYDSYAYESARLTRDHRRPGVPFADTYDKLSLRSGFDADDDYMLLDGFGRGYHGQLDANAIICLTDNGHRFLVDSDYLLCMEQDHSSVVVIRDGKYAPIPPVAALGATADLSVAGFARSSLTDYNGADWHRNILWVKDTFFLIADQFVARARGQFSFHTFWRTQGNGSLDGSRLSVGPRSQQLHIVSARRLPSFADHFRSQWLKLDITRLRQVSNATLNADEVHTQANLLCVLPGSEAGDVDVVCAPSSGCDCFVIRRDGEYVFAAVRHPNSAAALRIGGLPDAEATAEMLLAWPERLALCGCRRLKVGELRLESSAPIGVELDWASGQATLSLERRATVRIAGMSLPEATGPEPRQHQLEAGEYRLDLEAKRPPAAAGGQPGELYRKYAAAAAATSRDTVEAPDALSVLWEQSVRSDRMMLSLNGAVRGQPAVSADIEPLAVNPIAVHHNRPSDNSLAALLDASYDTIPSHVMWGPDKTVTVTFDLGRRCKIAYLFVRAEYLSAASFDGSIKCLYESMVVEGSNDGFRDDIRRIGAWEGLTKEVGRKNYTLGCKWAEAAQVRLVVKPLAGARVYLGEVEIHGRPPEGDAAINAQRVPMILTSARLDPAKPVLLSGTGDGVLSIVSAEGELLRRKQFPDAVNSISVEDVDGDGASDVLVGCADTRAYLLDVEANEKWVFDAPATSHWRSYPGRVHVVRAMDLDGDGGMEVVVGTENFIYGLDSAGRELWKFAIPDHVTCLGRRRLGDQRGCEVVAGSQYSWWPALDKDGRETKKRRGVMGMTLRSLLCTDINGDGSDEPIFGGEDGYVYFDFRGWNWPTGGAIVGLGRTTRDGRPAIIAASQNGSLYCFAADGTLGFRRDFYIPLSALATSETLIAVGTVGGDVYLLQADGTLVADAHLDAEVAGIVLLPDDTLVAATVDGRLTALGQEQLLF